jgi:hypothetical protein
LPTARKNLDATFTYLASSIPSVSADRIYRYYDPFVMLAGVRSAAAGAVVPERKEMVWLLYTASIGSVRLATQLARSGGRRSAAEAFGTI